jgi:hypothetical protein
MSQSLKINIRLESIVPHKLIFFCILNLPSYPIFSRLSRREAVCHVGLSNYLKLKKMPRAWDYNKPPMGCWFNSSTKEIVFSLSIWRNFGALLYLVFTLFWCLNTISISHIRSSPAISYLFNVCVGDPVGQISEIWSFVRRWR